MEFKNKKIALIGLGETSKGLVRFLLKQKADLTGLDKKTKNELSNFSYFSKLPIKLVLGPRYLSNLGYFDFIFLSPGIPIFPEIKKNKKNISSEIKLFFEFCQAPIIGVTGTNGKTTTTTLIDKILKKKDNNVFTGGNIGQTLIDKLGKIKKSSKVVLELSSFQLQDLEKSPHIAIILNITPDHLDRHKNFKEYLEAKKNIIKHQGKNDFAVLNKDQKLVWDLRKITEAKIFPFSTKEKLKHGAYIDNNWIVVANNGSRKKVLPISDLKLIGQHNLENVLASVTVGYLSNVSLKDMNSILGKFKGVEHRIEFVRNIKGVKFYNDSKATTPESTIAALKSFDNPIILIAGGYDKEADFSKLGKVISQKVKNLILIGKTASKIQAKAKSSPENNLKIEKVKTLKEATKIALKNSQAGDIILLSPACASYDMFKNYEERGELFKKFVKEL